MWLNGTDCMIAGAVGLGAFSKQFGFRTFSCRVGIDHVAAPGWVVATTRVITPHVSMEKVFEPRQTQERSALTFFFILSFDFWARKCGLCRSARSAEYTVNLTHRLPAEWRARGCGACRVGLGKEQKGAIFGRLSICLHTTRSILRTRRPILPTKSTSPCDQATK